MLYSVHKKVNYGVLHLFLLHNLAIRFVSLFTLSEVKKKISIQILVCVTYLIL